MENIITKLTELIDNDSKLLFTSYLIEDEIRHFINLKIEEFKPDYLIIIERKGTATLRALIESKKKKINFRWDRIISSNILDQLPEGYFNDKKILVFDEMMRHGNHLVNEIEKLIKFRLVNPDQFNQIFITVFAAHENAPTNIKINLAKNSVELLFSCYYKNLPHSSYVSIRQGIINLLQRSGSLLLDTEHIEMRIKLKSSIRNFIEALSRVCEVSTFSTFAGKVNITVLFDDTEAHLLDPNRLPRNSIQNKIVKKCRIIQRSEDEFSIIPIFIPEIPSEIQDFCYADDDLEILGKPLSAKGKYHFYNCALISSMEMLKWVFKDLIIWGDDNFSIIFPNEKIEDGMDGFTINHLLATYPTLNMSALIQRIKEYYLLAKIEGNELKKYKFTHKSISIYETEELIKCSRDLLKLMNKRIYNKCYDHYCNEEFSEIEDYRDDEVNNDIEVHSTEVYDLLRKFTLLEIQGMGELLKYTTIQTSTLFDFLINEAFLVTSVDRMENENGTEKLVRKFLPDGEIISEEIKNDLLSWGLALDER